MHYLILNQYLIKMIQEEHDLLGDFSQTEQQAIEESIQNGNKKIQRWILVLIVLNIVMSFLKANLPSFYGFAYKLGFYLGYILVFTLLFFIAACILSTAFSLLPFKNLPYRKRYRRVTLVIMLVLECLSFLGYVIGFFIHI